MGICEVISCDCDCHVNLTRLPSAPILYTNARIGERPDYPYEYNIDHTGSMSTDITSSLLFAGHLAISATNEPFESMVNPVNIQEPPTHMVNYWFDQLGLLLDPTSENPSNATSSSFQFLHFDRTTYVSESSLVYALQVFLIGCNLVRCWNHKP
jgi:hypothetical protein